jgi:hypothetical protein
VGQTLERLHPEITTAYIKTLQCYIESKMPEDEIRSTVSDMIKDYFVKDWQDFKSAFIERFGPLYSIQYHRALLR